MDSVWLLLVEPFYLIIDIMLSDIISSHACFQCIAEDTITGETVALFLSPYATSSDTTEDVAGVALSRTMHGGLKLCNKLHLKPVYMNDVIGPLVGNEVFGPATIVEELGNHIHEPWLKLCEVKRNI